MGWWLGLAPATLEFWVRFPNDRNQGKQVATLRESTGFPTGPTLVRDGQTSPHRPRLVVSLSTCPPLSPSPFANSFIIGTAVINTHTMVGIRSPIGLVVGSCTSHPGVLGSFPKREEPGKTVAPCIKVPGSSRVPPSSFHTIFLSPAFISARWAD